MLIPTIMMAALALILLFAGWRRGKASTFFFPPITGLIAHLFFCRTKMKTYNQGPNTISNSTAQ
ncbi:MAG: hypothetical protein ACYST6_08335 [Planctomycetota bacterium]